jgi:glycosyltransferase involved in cell wall biosynthesis
MESRYYKCESSRVEIGHPLGADIEAKLQGDARESQRQSGKNWNIAWCHAGDSGGSKRAAFEMVRELSKRGHIIDEYIIRDGEPNLNHWPLGPYVRHSYHTVFEPLWGGLRPYLLDVWLTVAKDNWKMRQIRRSLARLAGEMNRRGYDVVHVDQCSPSIAVSLLPYLQVPAVVYSHEASNLRHRAAAHSRSLLHRSVLRRKYVWLCELAERLKSNARNREDIESTRLAKLILTNSYYSKEAMFQRTFCRASVCRYGVDTQTFRPLSLPSERMVLSVGRVVPAKQHHLVLEAVNVIAAVRRPRVVIATPEDIRRQEDADYGGSLKRFAKDKGIDLEMRLNPSQDDLVTLYNTANAVIFVPIMEPFGLVALEAMACGTPVIGVREGGIRESVIDGKTGLLVERDVNEIAMAIDYLQQNPDARATMGQRAVHYVQTEWSWQRTIDRYEEEVRRRLF